MNILKNIITVILAIIVVFCLNKVITKYVWNIFYDFDTVFLVAICVIFLPTILMVTTCFVESKTQMKIAYSIPIGYLVTVIVSFFQAWSHTTFDLFELPSLKYVGTSIAFLSLVFVFVYFLITRTKFMVTSNIIASLINIVALVYAFGVKIF